MKMKTRLWTLLLALLLSAASLQGTVFAAAPKSGTGTDADRVFDSKIRELEKQYGVIKAGTEPVSVNTEDFFSDTKTPYGNQSDEGILFSEIRDFDRDGAKELLTLCRKRGTVTLTEDDYTYDEDRYEYHFDMYEAENGKCTLAASRMIGVFDIIDWSINFKSISVFLLETDKTTDICAETFISQQDHPSDTALVRFRYNGKEFTADNGVRFGYWYHENGARCMKPVSADALQYLSVIHPSEKTFWTDIVSTDSENDERFTGALKERLNALGFSLVKTRQEIIDEYYTEEMEEADFVEMDNKFSAISALDCYAPAKGRMTMLAHVHEHVEREMDDSGMVTIIRVIDSEKKTSKQR